METEQALKILKTVQDLAIKNGLFETTDDASAIHAAWVTVSNKITELEDLANTQADALGAMSKPKPKPSKAKDGSVPI
jgi:hypothetical protein